MSLLKVETDARTVKCYIDHKLDDHSFVPLRQGPRLTLKKSLPLASGSENLTKSHCN